MILKEIQSALLLNSALLTGPPLKRGQGGELAAILLPEVF